MSKKSVIGIVNSSATAERIVSQLSAAGFSSRDIAACFGQARNQELHPRAQYEGARGRGGRRWRGASSTARWASWPAIAALAISVVGPLIATGPLMAACAVRLLVSPWAAHRCEPSADP